MGKKYIIDLNPDCVEGEYLRIPARIAGEEQWLVTKAALTPYTEPDLEQVRKEAYENGYENGFVDGHLKAEQSGQKFYEDGYQRGLADAWEAATKILKANWRERNGTFGAVTLLEDIFLDNTPAEAIEKIRQYEQKQEEKKKTDYYVEMVKDAIETTAEEYGMSLDEVAAVLDKMRSTT